MLRRYTIVLNLFLVVVAVFVSQRVYTIWTSEAADDLGSMGVQEAQARSTAATSLRTHRTPRKAFEAIITKDLFRPERTEWVAPMEQKGATEQTAAAPAKKMRVYGIVIADDFKHAWLLEERKKRGKPKSVSEGDILEDGWKVSAINPDTVIVSRGTETVTYSLIEEGNPKPRKAPSSIAKKRKKRQSPTKRSKRAPSPRRPSSKRGR